MTDKFEKELRKKLQDHNDKWDRSIESAFNKLYIHASASMTRTLAEIVEDSDLLQSNHISYTFNQKKRGISSGNEDESRYKMARLESIVSSKENNNTSSVSKYSKRVMTPFNMLSRSRFNTPIRTVRPLNSKALSSRKVIINKPFALMRRPVKGEMAVSLSGSPLLVSSVANEEIANVNIPMPNGQILAILPTHLGEICSTDLPKFDPDTKKQLIMLSENLAKICKMCK